MSIKDLKSQITSNPQKSVTDLFLHNSTFSDIDISNISRNLGIAGKFDYSKYLKHQLENNISLNYLDCADIELQQLQNLYMINDQYVKVNKYGFPIKLDSKTVFHLLDQLIDKYKLTKRA